MTRPRPLSRKPRRWQCRFCPALNPTGRSRCVGCGIGRTTGRMSLKARCDAMARELCGLLAHGKCARCGGSGSDWAHRFPRRHHSLRWSMDNCDFLCRACHRFFTDRPAAFLGWLRARGVDVDALERRANEPWDKDYARVIAGLRAALAARKEAA